MDAAADYYADDLTRLPASLIWRFARQANPVFAGPTFAFLGLRKLLGWRFQATHGVRRDMMPLIGPDELPQAVRDAMTPALDACRTAGFRPCFFVKPGHIGGKRVYSAFLLDPAGTTAASVAWFRLRVGGQTAEKVAFACHSTRGDGVELDTGAMPDAHWMPELIPPGRDFLRLPDGTPEAAVIAAHRDRIRDCRDVRRFDGDSLKVHSEQLLRRLFDFLIERGFYARLSAAEVRRLAASPPP